MSDHEPRKRKKRKSQNKSENPRTDSESDKGLKESLRDGKKVKKHPKMSSREDVNVESSSPSSCIKCLFFILISTLAVGVGIVVMALQVSDSPAIFSEEVIEKIQTLIGDIKPDSSPAHVEYDPVISESETWKDGNKIDLDEHMEEKLLHEDELQDTYGIHLGRASSGQLKMDDFPDSPVPSSTDEQIDIKIPEVLVSPEENVFEEGASDNVNPPSQQDELPKSSPEADDRTEFADVKIEDMRDLPFQNVNDNVDNIPVENVEEFNDILVENVESNRDDSPIRTEEDVRNLYDKIDITNEYDYPIREELDKVDEIVDHSPDRALSLYKHILNRHKLSARATYGQARAYDRLSSVHRSNTFLDEAIAKYVEVMTLENATDMLYILSAERAANRSLFRGMYTQAVNIQKLHVNRFPENVTARNQMAVSYLMTGKNQEAERALIEVLKLDPDNGFAKAHLGFILKTHYSKFKESAKLLSEGIDSKAPGTIDGRFFYHLGDAYYRLSLPNKARQVYLSGAQQGLFLSADQRSLYNVDNLRGKPWWNFSDTKYSSSVKMLEKNWKIIRDEGLSLLNRKTKSFLPESESLQDTGDWKQLELFARGRVNAKNCELAPKTCAMIMDIPDARRCTRCQTKFSIMYPGTHVWPHTGPTNCRLRAHLGLVVPPGPRIRVANETRTWEEGKILIFDDSFEHEVWHFGDTLRLVLIVDFWHPELTSHQKATLAPI